MTSRPSRSPANRCTRCCSLNPLAFLVLLTLFLPACATTSQPFQFASASSLAGTNKQEDQESKLKSLSQEELLARGSRYLAGGNAKLAQVHFQMAVKKDNESAGGYAGLGEALAFDGEKQVAHQVLTRALAIDGKNRQALLATGKLYRSENDLKQAAAYFNRASETYPADPEILTEIAITCGYLGEEERAETLLAQVVALKPQDPAALNNLGFNYLLRKKYAEAITALQKALALKPDDSRIQDNLAAAYAMNNKSQRAFDLFNQSRGEAAAYNNLGYFYMIQGLKDPAKFALEKALLLSPRHYVRANENLRRLGNDL